jgi:hypothetical protein
MLNHLSGVNWEIRPLSADPNGRRSVGAQRKTFGEIKEIFAAHKINFRQK